MGKLLNFCLLVSSVLFGYGFLSVSKILFTIPSRPNSADDNPWWGPGEPSKTKGVINEFSINISTSVIRDLKRRLEDNIEFHPPLEGIQQQYGFNTRYFKKIIGYWLKEYNWTKQEEILNSFPQYTVNIQGLNIYYLHVKPKEVEGVKVLPLLLLHGWPSSPREFFDLIPLLVTPQEKRKVVFEVISPHLPGFGFSDASVRPGLNPMQIAIIMKNLMSRLDYELFYVQGGDWGGHIAQIMASLFPDKIVGLHSTFCFINTPLAHLKVFVGEFMPSLVIDEKFVDKLYPMKDKMMYLLKETGYLHIQSTKPDTLGVALRDSPVGLAAYILEKFSQFSNPKYEFREEAGLQEIFQLDELLDNVMIYWITRSITTSMRIYAENFSKDYIAMNVPMIPTNVPTACARFSNELVYQPEWVLRDKFTNLIQVSDLEGGHFAAMEVPYTLSEDMFTFVEKVEKSFGFY